MIAPQVDAHAMRITKVYHVSVPNVQMIAMDEENVTRRNN